MTASVVNDKYVILQHLQILTRQIHQVFVLINSFVLINDLCPRTHGLCPRYMISVLTNNVCPHTFKYCSYKQRLSSLIIVVLIDNVCPQ